MVFVLFSPLSNGLIRGCLVTISFQIIQQKKKKRTLVQILSDENMILFDVDKKSRNERQSHDDCSVLNIVMSLTRTDSEE